jgi:hypothetical protein
VILQRESDDLLRFMTELIHPSQVTEEEPMVQRLPRCRLAGDAQAFGSEPNGLVDPVCP